MEVVLLLVGILGVALIVVPRMRGRRSGARRPAPSRRRVRARKAAAQAAATSPVATWTPAEAAASRSGDWEVWDDELGWEGVEAAPPAASAPEPEPEPAPAAEAEIAPPREPDREAWERWRASELSDSGPGRTGEPVAAPGGELPSVERWRERQANPPGEWLDDDDGLGWESSAEPAETVALQRDDAAPARGGEPAPAWEFAGEGGPAREFSRGHGKVTPRVELPRLEPAAHAPVTAPEAEPAPPAAVTGREWLTDTAWEAQPAPATQTDGASGGNGNGHVVVPAAAPRRGRRRLSPVLLVAIYAAAGIGVVILVSTLLLGGSSQPKKSRALTAPQPKATATAQATPGSAVDDPVAAPTPDPAVAEAARKAKAAARSFRRERASAARREHRAVAGARKAYRRQHTPRPTQTSAVQPPAYTPPPPTSTAASPPSYRPPPASPRPASPPPASPPPSRCEFCIG
jgi:hypothetical protein